MPDSYGLNLSKSEQSTLDNWVKNGGTLIAIDGSAAALAKDKGLSQVRLLADIAEKQSEYNLVLQREWLAKATRLENIKQLNDAKVSTTLTFPWSQDKDLKPLSKEQFKQWEKWTRNFAPSGAIVAGTVDQKHFVSLSMAR